MALTTLSPQTAHTAFAEARFPNEIVRREAFASHLGKVADALREEAKVQNGVLVVRYPLGPCDHVFEVDAVLKRSMASEAQIGLDPWLPKPTFLQKILSYADDAHIMDLVNPAGPVPIAIHTVEGPVRPRYLMVLPLGGTEPIAVVDLEASAVYGSKNIGDALKDHGYNLQPGPFRSNAA